MSAAREGWALDDEAWPAFHGSPERMRVLDADLARGVALGTTRDGRPASLALVRPAPVRVVVLGQAWLASLLALRATVLGATTFIVTERPAPWRLLVGAVGGSTPFATVVDPGAAPGLPAASIAAPVCTLHDGGAGAEAALARAPWQTSVHLLFRLGGQPASVLDAADLVLVPRLPDNIPADEVNSIVEVLRLPPTAAGQLAALGATEVLAATRSRLEFVTVQATPTEMSALRTA